MKKVADDDFKFDENSRKFSKWVENTVGKGEIAHYKQFLLFQSVFKRLILQTRKNQGLFGKGLNLLFGQGSSFLLFIPFPNENFRLFQAERVC